MVFVFLFTLLLRAKGCGSVGSVPIGGEILGQSMRSMSTQSHRDFFFVGADM